MTSLVWSRVPRQSLSCAVQYRHSYVLPSACHHHLHSCSSHFSYQTHPPRLSNTGTHVLFVFLLPSSAFTSFVLFAITLPHSPHYFFNAFVMHPFLPHWQLPFSSKRQLCLIHTFPVKLRHTPHDTPIPALMFFVFCVAVVPHLS
jgi:hypothetical protein